MKKLLVSLILLIISVATFANNIQTGYVKTRGRMGADGQVIAGKRLGAATIVLQNGSSVVSTGSGDFSLKLTTARFFLKDVKKSGYLVSDPDILSKQYTWSENPLILVLDEPATQQDDKLASERRLRRTLQKQLQQREDELEALREENKVTEEKYRVELQKIYSDQESNEKFISEMSERYSKIDFDQLDGFQRQITQFIQNGELVRADSLLRTKGEMSTRENEIKKIINANNAERKELDERKRILDESEKNATVLIDDFASDCYNFFQICKLKCDIDSAGYWLKKRAELDTRNAEWQLDAAAYLSVYVAEYDEAELFYNRIINLISESNNISAHIISDCYSGLGLIEYSRGNYNHALDIYSKSVNILNNLNNSKSVNIENIASAYGNQGAIYLALGDYEKSEECLNKSIDLLKDIEFSKDQIINIYNTIGHLKIITGNFHEALEVLNKAFDFESSEGVLNNTNVCTTLNNIGTIYNNIGQHEKALTYFNKALSIKKQLFGNNHPSLALAVYNIGFQYEELGDFQSALKKYYEAKDIIIKTLGENNVNITNIYIAIGGIYKEYLNDNEQALNYMTKTIEILRNMYESNEHIDIARCHNNIGSIYACEKDFEKGLNHLNESISIYKSILGEQHPKLITPYLNISEIYADLKKFNIAKIHVYKALQISKQSFGDIHPLTASCYNNLGSIYSKSNEFDNALSSYQKANEILTQIFGSSHLYIAKTNINIGKLFYDQGDLEKTYNYYTEAIKMQRDILGNDHKDVKLTEKLLEDLNFNSIKN